MSREFIDLLFESLRDALDTGRYERALAFARLAFELAPSEAELHLVNSHGIAAAKGDRALRHTIFRVTRELDPELAEQMTRGL